MKEVYDGNTYGRHVFAELQDMKFEVLDDMWLVIDSMINASVEAGATVIDHFGHKFEPCGFSGVVVLAESHVTIHTFPEHGYASFDAYTCGHKADPMKILELLIKDLDVPRATIKQIKRGLPEHLPPLPGPQHGTTRSHLE